MAGKGIDNNVTRFRFVIPLCNTRMNLVGDFQLMFVPFEKKTRSVSTDIERFFE